MSDRLRVTQQSLDDSQALSLSVFETMTTRLRGMVEFAWSMHQRDPEGSEADITGWQRKTSQRLG